MGAVLKGSHSLHGVYSDGNINGDSICLCAILSYKLRSASITDRTHYKHGKKFSLGGTTESGLRVQHS